MLRSVTYDQTRRFLAWACATLVVAYIAGILSDKIFKGLK